VLHVGSGSGNHPRRIRKRYVEGRPVVGPDSVNLWLSLALLALGIVLIADAGVGLRRRRPSPPVAPPYFVPPTITIGIVGVADPPAGSMVTPNASGTSAVAATIAVTEAAPPASGTNVPAPVATAPLIVHN
jgi:hypothetical protein